jgi:hypothetical protein
VGLAVLNCGGMVGGGGGGWGPFLAGLYCIRLSWDLLKYLNAVFPGIVKRNSFCNLFLFYFLDIKVGSTEIGRIMMELFSDICPKTAENFR